MNFYESGEKNTLRLAVRWIVDVVAVLSMAFYTVYGFGGRVVVSGHSMEPAFESGDVLLMNRLAYDLGKPERFDVAVYERGEMGQNIKRVIGLPGETVQIRDNLVYIDKELLLKDGEPLTVSLPGIAEYPIELGGDEYFLLGDNCETSEDSRFVNVGNVGREQLTGKIWLRIQPFNRFQLIRH